MTDREAAETQPLAREPPARKYVLSQGHADGVELARYEEVRPTYRCRPWMRFLSMALLVIIVALSTVIYYMLTMVFKGYIKQIDEMHSDSSGLYMLVWAILFVPVYIETSFTLVCMLLSLYFTIRAPERILISEVNGTRTICLCIFVFIMAATSVYTTVVMAMPDARPNYDAPFAVPLVRSVLLLGYFSLLIVVSCL